VVFVSGGVWGRGGFIERGEVAALGLGLRGVLFGGLGWERGEAGGEL